MIASDRTLKPVLIAGAGPTGMMAALELARFGIPVRLVEKKLEPETTSRAVGVEARTLELLEQRGLARQLVEKGNKGVAMSAWGSGERVFRIEYGTINSKYRYLLFVSQAETEGALRTALADAGVQVEWGVTMTSFGVPEHGDVVKATLEDRGGALEQLQCSYVISAEGTHSTVRKTLNLQFEGKSLDEQYALADLHLDGDLPESDFHLFGSENGFMGMFPMGEGRWRVMASDPISDPTEDTEPSMAEIQKLYHERSPVPVTFHDMTWSSWFHINSRMIHELKVGRVFLGGDAAHIHSPAGAQGMNTGMQDMVNLTWKLAMVMKGQAKPGILETYSEERVPVIEDVLTKTEALTSAIGSESHAVRTIYNHVMPWITSSKFVQHNATERLSQIALNYRGSSLSVSDGHSGHLKAGDRMPDLPVMALNRKGSAEQHPRPVTTFELMDPSLFTIFYTNIPDPEKTHAEINHQIVAWHDRINGRQIGPGEGTVGESDSFNHLFGTKPGITLVRPDGYIAFTGTDRSVGALASYCDAWLVPQEGQDKQIRKAKEIHDA